VHEQVKTGLFIVISLRESTFK